MHRIYSKIASILLGITIITTVFAGDILSFDRALKLAYANNPELQAVLHKANEIKGEFIQNGLLPNPLIKLEAENIGGSGAFNGFESAETTLSITQPIPTGGKLAYAQKASFTHYQAMLFAIKRKKAELYIKVGEAYVDVYYAGQWHKVTLKLVKLNERIVKEITRRLKAGASSELDLRLAQIALGDVEIIQTKAYRDVKKRYAVIERLMGKKHATIPTFVDKGLPHQNISWDHIEKFINKNVFINEKTSQLEAKRAFINAVKKDVSPTILVQLGGRHFSDDGENALVASITSPLPVFNRNQGKFFSAEADYTKTLEELRALKLKLHQELTAEYLDLCQSTKEILKVNNELLPLARKAAKLANEGYQQGLYSYIELLNAMQALYKEERHYQLAHARRDKAIIKITGLISNGAQLECQPKKS